MSEKRRGDEEESKYGKWHKITADLKEETAQSWSHDQTQTEESLQTCLMNHTDLNNIQTSR